MVKLTKRLALAAVMGLAGVIAPLTSSAGTLTAYICNDLTCSGGDDLTMSDADNDGVIALINLGYSGFTLTSNISQSKPALGQGMDLLWGVTSGASGGGTIYMYAIDSAFVGPASLSAHVGGTNDTGGSLLATICAGAALLPGGGGGDCLSSVLFGAGPFSGDFGPVNTALNPYQALLGVTVTIGGANRTSTGDLRMNQVPEPSTIALLGLGLLGAATFRRRSRV